MLKLKKGVSYWNVITLLFGFFAVQTQLNLQVGFTSFLLDENFGKTDSDAAEILGNMGFIGDIASVSTELVLGTLMDLVGRKIPSIAGLLLSGTGTLVSPWPNKLVGIYVLRCAINIGCLPLLWSPF